MTSESADQDVVLLAVAALARGEMILVVDDADRENEVDLVLAADAMTPEALTFLVTHGRGLVCSPMTGERLDVLGLPDMVVGGNDPLGTRFTVSVDLDVLGSTGISAVARSATLRALADPATTADDLRRPGHIFPLRGAEGGVLARRGHTEASLDLVRLAGRSSAAVICEVLADDGTMLRGEAITAFASRHGLVLVTIAQLVDYLREAEPARPQVIALPEPVVRREVETSLPTAQGAWRAIGYSDASSGAEHVALVLGDVQDGVPLVRIHSECLTGDVLGSQRCDCGDQLDLAARAIADEGAGVLIYVRGHEGRGIGLLNKLRAYALQDRGRDTVDANLELGLPEDARTYEQSGAILLDLGLSRVRLLTNNPLKVRGLEAHGLVVEAAVPLRAPVTAHSAAYLATKALRMGHELGTATG